MSGRVFIRYVDGTHADASWSKLLSRQAVEEIFSGTEYDVAFEPDAASVRKGRGKAFKARLGVVYRKPYYNFTGMKLPRYDRLSIEISSENPELLDRVLETLDQADNIFNIDDAGRHHGGRVEIVDHSGIKPRVLTGWACILEEGDSITPHPVHPTYVHVAEVTMSKAGGGSNSKLYVARTEAGMWRKMREGEGVPKGLMSSSDVDWLQEHGRNLRCFVQELFD